MLPEHGKATFQHIIMARHFFSQMNFVFVICSFHGMILFLIFITLSSSNFHFYTNLISCVGCVPVFLPHPHNLCFPNFCQCWGLLFNFFHVYQCTYFSKIHVMMNPIWILAWEVLKCSVSRYHKMREPSLGI